MQRFVKQIHNQANSADAKNARLISVVKQPFGHFRRSMHATNIRQFTGLAEAMPDASALQPSALRLAGVLPWYRRRQPHRDLRAIRSVSLQSRNALRSYCVATI